MTVRAKLRSVEGGKWRAFCDCGQSNPACGYTAASEWVRIENAKHHQETKVAQTYVEPRPVHSQLADAKKEIAALQVENARLRGAR